MFDGTLLGQLLAARKVGTKVMSFNLSVQKSINWHMEGGKIIGIKRLVCRMPQSLLLQRLR